MTIYLVIAYRWGCTNLHQYCVYCGPDRTKADALAQAEQYERGGKYGCAVYEWDADGTEQKEICYFGASMNGENHPFHNYRIDFFQTLGHKFARYAEGFETYVEAKDFNGKSANFIVEKPADAPQWVKDEYERAKSVCDAMTGFQEKRAALDQVAKDAHG